MSAGKLCSSCGQVAKGLPPGAAFCPNCGRAFSQIRDFGPGTVVGQYRILKELGAGGIGQVFMAHPIDNPNMRIALKVLQKEFLDNATVRERFNREIRLLASLNLDYIVRYYNSWNDEDGEYLAMEYIDGMNLSQMVDQDYEFTPDVVLEIMETLAMVFRYAYDRLELLHRDIKPSNIMISNNGELKILDFGLAKSLKEDNMLTLNGRVMGSPGFMSPEQFRNAKDVDVTADIFSLGATAYFLLTKKNPFDGENELELYQNMISTTPESIRKQNPAVSEHMETLIMSMLSKEPKKRPFSWKKLQVDIDRVKNGRPPVPNN
jgi:serine/threonine-protein kinase